ncbi:hypothetical protein SUGI_0629790 [Cryptomeria japonica]|nr:hypothetical protein SUGI_0629790 [Cryptomeria japonica]
MTTHPCGTSFDNGRSSGIRTRGLNHVGSNIAAMGNLMGSTVVLRKSLLILIFTAFRLKKVENGFLAVKVFCLGLHGGFGHFIGSKYLDE